jgi:hypothetical protein
MPPDAPQPGTASGSTVQATGGIREFRNSGIVALWVIPAFLHPRIPVGSFELWGDDAAMTGIRNRRAHVDETVD